MFYYIHYASIWQKSINTKTFCLKNKLPEFKFRCGFSYSRCITYMYFFSSQKPYLPVLWHAKVIFHTKQRVNSSRSNLSIMVVQQHSMIGSTIEIVFPLYLNRSLRFRSRLQSSCSHSILPSVLFHEINFKSVMFNCC